MTYHTGTLYDAIYGYKDYDAEAAQLHTLIQEQLPGARTLLDVACGTGKHLQPLAAHYTVAGLDINPALLATARERLPNVPLHQGDMRNFDLGTTFDVVTCLFSAIGYLTTEADLHAAVANLVRHGRLVIVEPWFTPDQWNPGGIHLRVADQPTLKVARMIRSLVDGNIAVMDETTLVGTPDGFEVLREEHRLLLATEAQMLTAFAAAGRPATLLKPGLIGRGLYSSV